MVDVTICKNGIKLEGHAGYHTNGSDIVCAAISTLTCNLINSLNHFTDSDIEYTVKSGNVCLKWDKLENDGKLLVESWKLGLKAVKENYPESINLIEE